VRRSFYKAKNDLRFTKKSKQLLKLMENSLEKILLGGELLYKAIKKD
jgi:hypothetical protein